ncbi:MAG: mechanosensitive ion channel [Tannerellaceae bacterium]
MLLTVVESSSKIESAIKLIMEQGAELGFTLLKAFIIFVVGRMLINLINRIVKKVLSKRDIDPSVKTFMGSLVNVVLMILLIVSVVGALGVQTTSFAALLASAGVAIGMALSGNLQNFAGGLVILLFKPYKIGDYIEALNISGTVREIQIFHTVLTTVDNKVIYVPNGSLSSGVVTNFSHQTTRRVDWTIGIEYGEDYERVKQVIERILAAEPRLLTEPAPPFIALQSLAASSVNVVVRVWVKADDYWNVYFDINRTIYETFNAEGIGFPFPQLTIHKA